MCGRDQRFDLSLWTWLSTAHLTSFYSRLQDQSLQFADPRMYQNYGFCYFYNFMLLLVSFQIHRNGNSILNLCSIFNFISYFYIFTVEEMHWWMYCMFWLVFCHLDKSYSSLRREKHNWENSSIEWPVDKFIEHLFIDNDIGESSPLWDDATLRQVGLNYIRRQARQVSGRKPVSSTCLWTLL